LPPPVRSGWYADAVADGMTSAVFLSDDQEKGDLIGRPEDPLPRCSRRRRRRPAPCSSSRSWSSGAVGRTRRAAM
jgi:hypothetical protein